MDASSSFPFSGFSGSCCINELMSYLLPTWALKITLPTFGLKAPVIIRVKVKKREQMLVFIALHYRGYTSLEVKGWCLSVESNHAQQVMNGHARLWERFDSMFDSSYLSVYHFSWLRLYTYVHAAGHHLLAYQSLHSFQYQHSTHFHF